MRVYISEIFLQIMYPYIHGYPIKYTLPSHNLNIGGWSSSVMCLHTPDEWKPVVIYCNYNKKWKTGWFKSRASSCNKWVTFSKYVIELFNSFLPWESKGASSILAGISDGVLHNNSWCLLVVNYCCKALHLLCLCYIPLEKK